MINSNGHSPAYAEAALADEIRIIGSVPKGKGLRNAAINRGAYKIGSLVGAGALPKSVAREALLSAACTNGYVADHGKQSTLNIIEDGLKAGIASPRELSGKTNTAAPPRRVDTTTKNIHSAHALPQRTTPNQYGKPKFCRWGEDGPPRYDDELRRHVYRRDGIPVRIKIKSRSGDNASFVNWYRVRDGSAVGWQSKQPTDYRPSPYVSAAIDPFDTELVADEVWWTEGEKDTDTLSKLNIASFTFGGCGDGLPAGIEPYLSGRKIIIVADNDEPGREHAEKKAARAHAAGAASIKIIHFPELPLKGDVSDFITNGGSVEQLLANVEATQPWTPAPIETTNAFSGSPIPETRLKGESVIAQPARSWDDPDLSLLDDRRGELPDFPIDQLDPLWRSFMERAAHGAGVTTAHVAVPMLAVISGLLGAARRIQVTRSWIEVTALWWAVIGCSGTGKTPGLDVVMRHLALIQKNRRSEDDKRRLAHARKVEVARAAKAKYKLDVAAAIESGKTPPDPPPETLDVSEFVPQRLYVSDSTIEKLGLLLQARPSGLILIGDELAGLFSNMSRYNGGSDREFWLQSWNGKAYSVERMGRPSIAIDHLLIGVLGGFQPDKLARSFKGDDDGLYARLCFAWPAEAPYRPLTDDAVEIDDWLLNALDRIVALSAVDDEGALVSRAVALSDDARSTFEHFRELAYRERGALDGRERELWAKGQSQVLRLAGTLSFMHWASSGGQEPATIDRRPVDAAVAIWRGYFWPHGRAALRQVGLTDRHANARRVLRWLCAKRYFAWRFPKPSSLFQHLHQRSNTLCVPADVLKRNCILRQAYKIAGFRYDSGNASRMINAPAFQARLQILTERRAQKVTTVCEVTTESLIAECEEARLLALALKQPQSAIAAIKEKGVLSGKRIERSETGEPGEFDGMNEQELAEYIGQKMAELGIEIVREESRN